MTTTNEKNNIMKKHGITCEMKFIYIYKNYRYDDLEQAVNFAVFEQQRLDAVPKH
ncbi:hypothetical protein ACFODZ_03305 [Marinicella sediminis]|uniref:Uncharacterized protein n=1 Tax=Marinicella sediminis TaxID=1792834 RepID=A0ABV7J5C0_9GAMM|nr:hypothetical protein [Marinicella sediminis]